MIKSIEKYYVQKFGNPNKRFELKDSSGTNIILLKWEEGNNEEGVCIYATIGASSILGDKDMGCEFFIGLIPEQDDVIYSLAEAAVDGNGSKNIPLSGDTITLTYDLWKGTHAKTYMFRNDDLLLEPIILEGKHIRFIKLIPLFSNELEYKKTHGEKALIEKFELLNVPFWDPKRKSAF